MGDSESNLKNLQQAFKLFAAAVGGLFVMVVLIGVAGYVSNQHRIEESQHHIQKLQDTEEALCAFRADLQRRYNLNLTLTSGPGQTVFGIPKDVILVTMKGQEATLKSLKGLDCNE